MPRFHFEIVDGYTVKDPHGMEIPTESQAKKVAEEMAKQIAADVETCSLTDVVVKTHQGEVIHKVPIKSDSNS